MLAKHIKLPSMAYKSTLIWIRALLFAPKTLTVIWAKVMKRLMATISSGKKTPKKMLLRMNSVKRRQNQNYWIIRWDSTGFLNSCHPIMTHDFGIIILQIEFHHRSFLPSMKNLIVISESYFNQATSAKSFGHFFILKFQEQIFVSNEQWGVWCIQSSSICFSLIAFDYRTNFAYRS